jgi:hypothetical protein
VLTESEVEGNRRFGFTDNYVRVAVPSEGVEDNVLVNAVLEDVEFGCCIGSVAEGRGML